VVKQRAEDSRVAVRNVRRHARQELESLEKGGELSKDELERVEKELDKSTNARVAEIDSMVSHKEQELLDV
jgi:ribosome recycling factor